MADATLADPAGHTTRDAFLGGRLEVVQRGAGHHRAGLEAMLLAASVDRGFAGTAVDLGAGAGVAGLAVAARCERATVVLVERDTAAIDCARASLRLPANRGFADRVTVAAADVTWAESDRAAAGLVRASADLVVTNPPFSRSGTASPSPARADAHVIGDGGLEPWVRTAASVLKPGGRLVVIFRADGLDSVLAACRGRFGALAILPVHPRADRPAHRVMVDGILGSRTASRLLPPLVLHAATGSAFRREVEAILRHGATLSALASRRRAPAPDRVKWPTH